MREIHVKHVDLLVHTADDSKSLAEVYLSVARRMRQRHKHLPAPGPDGPYIILHDRIAAGIAVLSLKPLEDPLRRMTLLRRRGHIRRKNGVDHRGHRPQLGLLRRLLPHIARWH